MIIAELVPKNGFVFLRFVEPGENVETKPYITLNSMDDAKGRINFRSRNYIVEKLTSWLNQRSHALPGAEFQINLYASWVAEVKLRSLSYVCDFVNRKRDKFESIAPNESSKCYSYYKKNILTILDFCTDYTNNNQNHD
ncbi:hypothetical protein DBR40_24860 [Pedobacter sp. KBW01]|uniref:hypothetical protein n=1 Tax=Pedobacter sp. KBW01 TaxID=2153364 RepID=UPI000F5A5042|nr:hypothetical protein [Pedobacter sp. KBW01]RQO65105.1 hypothetical protein DBR40_24860 [Pedobacter sp. KBW01]